MKTAIILAAGKGTKMWPYGETQPKAALPVAGRPLIQHTVEHLLSLGFEEVVVVVGHLEEQVRSAVGRIPQVSFHVQKNPAAGTAAALRELHGTRRLDDVLVVYGDVLVVPSDLRRLLDTHRSSEAIFTALVAPVPDSTANWLAASISGNELRRVVGHPRGGSHRLAGVYALREAAWPWVVNNPGLVHSVPVGGMPPLEAELAQSLQDAITGGEKVGAVETQDLFTDLDKPWHLLEANARYMQWWSQNLTGDVIPKSAKISPEAEIQGRLVLGENVVIGPRVRIQGDLWVGNNTVIDNGAIVGGRTYIGSNCKVQDYCQIDGNSVVGDHCVIKHCAEFGGVLMERVYLYHYMEFSGVIGRSTDLGAATVCGTMRFDDGDTIHNIKGRKEQPVHGANATYIGDFCRTGVNVILMPGVKIGPYSVIGPAVLVNEDIPSRTLVFVEQQLQKRSWGPERYGW